LFILPVRPSIKVSKYFERLALTLKKRGMARSDFEVCVNGNKCHYGTGVNTQNSHTYITAQLDGSEIHDEKRRFTRHQQNQSLAHRLLVCAIDPALPKPI
jgi:hypothetical protein